MTILGLAETLKIMNRPDPTATLFDGIFLEKNIGRGLKFDIMQCVLSEFGIDIFNSLETMRFLAAKQYR